MTAPTRRDDGQNPFARQNPWGAPGPGVMRVGPLPKTPAPKAAPARPAAIQRPITAPARGGRGGVLTGSALPLPTPRAPAPAPQPQPQPHPQPAPSEPEFAAPPITAELPAAPPATAAEIAHEPVEIMPLAAAAEPNPPRDLKTRLKRRAPVLAGVGYVVLVAVSAVFLLPMRPPHVGPPEGGQTPSQPSTPAVAPAAPASEAQPIRAAVATADPAPAAAVTPKAAAEPPKPRPQAKTVKLAAAEPTPKPAPSAAAEPHAAPDPVVPPVVVTQNAEPIAAPPLPEPAPKAPAPPQDPEAPMVTRLPEMR